MNKSDIASKVKNAIEEKLTSIGAYVDKELPEYILVMIANKKSKEAMEKDLQLFLGQETSHFIEWLHGLLDKVQSDPDNAFRTNKSDKIESSTEKKKKQEKEKEKSKTKSKTRKSDEKKDHKRVQEVKARRKSHSQSPLPLPTQPKPVEIKEREASKVKKRSTPEKSVKSVATKAKVDIEPPAIDITLPEDDCEIPESATVVIQSVVKVTERPMAKNDTFKASATMAQRDIHAADVIIKSEKRESPKYQLPQRSSVFSRLGRLEMKPQLSKMLMDYSDLDAPVLPNLKRNIHETVEDDEEMQQEETVILPKRKRVEKLQQRPISPNFIVTLNGAENIGFSLNSRLGPKRKQQSDDEMDDTIDDNHGSPVINDVDADDLDEIESEGIKTKDSTINNIAAAQVKCRYWPVCKNKETCPFFHPIEPCKMFPGCKFGSLCLFIHPNCRFEPYCNKPECPFTHYKPRLFIKPAMSSNAAPVLQRCAFYPNCTNVNCKFFHPNLPCKFGSFCKSKDTCMFYHPAVPHRSELKLVMKHNNHDSVATLTNTSSDEAVVTSMKNAQIAEIHSV